MKLKYIQKRAAHIIFLILLRITVLKWSPQGEFGPAPRFIIAELLGVLERT